MIIIIKNKKEKEKKKKRDLNTSKDVMLRNIIIKKSLNISFLIRSTIFV